jgi:CheY-like chemotaxis protein
MTDTVSQSESAQRWANSAWAFYAVADNVDQCVYLLNRDGCCFAANTALMEWLDRPLSEIIGRKCIDFWPPFVAQRDAADLNRILRGERFDSDELRPRRGQQLLVRMRKTPLRDESGVVCGAVCLFREIAAAPIGQTPLPWMARVAVQAPIEGTVLLIEPDVSVILMTSRILEAEGFHVMSVREGRQAVKIFRQRQAEIDLVILEQNLPGPSGLETMNELLAINRHPRILMTNSAGKPEPSWCAKTPGLGYLNKPHSPTQLMRAVRHLLSTKPAKDEG